MRRVGNCCSCCCCSSRHLFFSFPAAAAATATAAAGAAAAAVAASDDFSRGGRPRREAPRFTSLLLPLLLLLLLLPLRRREGEVPVAIPALPALPPAREGVDAAQPQQVQELLEVGALVCALLGGEGGRGGSPAAPAPAPAPEEEHARARRRHAPAGGGAVRQVRRFHQHARPGRPHLGVQGPQQIRSELALRRQPSGEELGEARYLRESQDDAATGHVRDVQLAVKGEEIFGARARELDVSDEDDAAGGERSVIWRGEGGLGEEGAADGAVFFLWGGGDGEGFGRERKRVDERSRLEERERGERQRRCDINSSTPIIFPLATLTSRPSACTLRWHRSMPWRRAVVI